jgi:hypothetical protein
LHCKQFFAKIFGARLMPTKNGSRLSTFKR